MKSTATNSCCFTGASCVARRHNSCASSRARLPVRRLPPRPRAAAAAASAAHALDHAAYVELPIAARNYKVLASGSTLPRVLHVDTETGTATVLACLLGSDVHVTHVSTLGEARELLRHQIFSLVVLDPALPDGDAKTLLPLLSGTPLLVYGVTQPTWRDMPPPPFLSKTWTTARQLWTRMSSML